MQVHDVVVHKHEKDVPKEGEGEKTVKVEKDDSDSEDFQDESDTVLLGPCGVCSEKYSPTRAFISCDRCKSIVCEGPACYWTHLKLGKCCTPPLLEKAKLKKDGGGWWHFTEGSDHAPKNSAATFRKEFIQDLERAVYLEFDGKGSCVNDSFVGEDIICFRGLLSGDKLQRAREAAIDLYRDHPDGLMRWAHGDEYDQHMAKFVVATKSTKDHPRYCGRLEPASLHDSNKEKVLQEPPDYVMEPLVGAAAKLRKALHDSNTVVPRAPSRVKEQQKQVYSYHPTINYFSGHNIPHIDDYSHSGPGGGIANLVLQGEGALVLSPEKESEEGLPLRVVQLSPGDCVYFSGRMRCEWDHCVYRTDLVRGNPIPLKNTNGLSSSRIIFNYRLGEMTADMEKMYHSVTAEYYNENLKTLAAAAATIPKGAPAATPRAPKVPAPAQAKAESRPPQTDKKPKVTPAKPASRVQRKPTSKNSSFANHYWHNDTLTGQQLGAMQMTNSIQRKTSDAPVIQGNTNYFAQRKDGSCYEVHIIKVGRWLYKGSTKRAVILRSRPMHFNKKKKEYVVSAAWEPPTLLNGMQVNISICHNV